MLGPTEADMIKTWTCYYRDLVREEMNFDYYISRVPSCTEKSFHFFLILRVNLFSI